MLRQLVHIEVEYILGICIYWLHDASCDVFMVFVLQTSIYIHSH
jgi:hypothetical protein